MTDQDLLLATVLSIPTHRVVFHVGAGNGDLSRRLAGTASVRRVLCADASAASVLEARSRHEPPSDVLPDGGAVCAESGATIEYFCDRFEASIVADESVDVVLLTCACDSSDAVAATLLRVLRDSGHAVLRADARPSASPAFQLVRLVGDGEWLVLCVRKTPLALPPRTTQTSFGVAGSSLRVLQRRMRADDDDADDLDTNFFEPDYDLAAATGSNVWESSFVCANALNDAPTAARVFDRLRGRRVVELGAGVGLLSVALAAFGAHVLATDLAPVVRGLLCDNVARNTGAAACEPLRSDVWRRAAPLGERGGSIAVAALNWLEPVARQFDEPLDADFVVAADTLWLESLVQPFVTTALALLGDVPTRRMLLAYRERGGALSQTFCTTERVLSAFRERGCVASELWRHASHKSPDKAVIVFELALQQR